MKIYFDEDFCSLVVEGAKMPFPPKSLAVTRIANILTVWQADGQTRVVKSDYSKLRDKGNNAFLTAAAAQLYLEGEFSKTGTPEVLPDFLGNVQGILS